MRRKLFVPVLLIAAVAALLLAGRSAYNRAVFATRVTDGVPTRISYCERPYLPGPHVTRTTIDATANGPEVLPFRQVSSTAGGWPIFAKPLADSARYRYADSPPLPCAMVIYLKVGADDYVTYGLSDGP